MQKSSENEEKIRALFQKFAEEDKSSPVVNNLLTKASERNMPLLDYITETGPEIREILTACYLRKYVGNSTSASPLNS